MLINPILASSARRRMRSWKTPLILLLFGAALLGIAFVTALMPLMGESMTISSARNGLDSYIVLVCAEFALIVLVAPAMTAGSIAGERERQTLEMLLVTNTGSFRIALGKLLESLGYLAFLIVAMLPFNCSILAYGSVGLPYLFQSALFLLLTGGEPLLYPAFRAVYLAVRKRGMIVTVNTNGTLLNEDWAAFFAKNPPRRMNVTLYGASGETYKSLCGDETGYAKAMRGIQLLQAHGVPVKVGVSVVRQNRHDLETLFQITKEQDLELEPDTYMMSTESGQHEARLSPEEAAAASLAATKIKLGTVSFHEYAQRTVQALESAVPETDAGMRCLAGRCSFAVGWRGDLRPCVMLGALSVPIEHNDVQAAWRAVWEKSAALKQNEACVVCKLRPLCRACPASSLREGGAFGTVPPYVCAYTKALYRLLCAESTAPEILKKGETVPHAQAL